MPSYRRIYLDTSVYLALVKGEPGRAPLAREILEDARKGSFEIVASTLVAVEVIKDKGAPAPLGKHNEQLIDAYLFHEFIVWVELDLPLAKEARRIAGENGLKPADAIHLASAVRGECSHLFRWDNRFTAGIVDNVKVCEPFWDGQPELA